jgi:hypothetical protein
MACCFVKFCIFEERFDFTMLSGVRLAGPVDRAWRELPAESTQLVAKTIDLKAAYKQFPIFPTTESFYFVLKRPTDGVTMGLCPKRSPSEVLHQSYILIALRGCFTGWVLSSTSLGRIIMTIFLLLISKFCRSIQERLQELLLPC